MKNLTSTLIALLFSLISFQSIASCDTLSYLNVKDSTLYAQASNSSAIAYKWDFGDGTTAVGKNVIHKYADTGLFVVCLRVFCSSKDSTEYCFTIRTHIKCKANFTYKQVSSSKYTIEFKDSSNFIGTSAYWNFSDFSSRITLDTASFTYNKPGNYWVNYVLFNAYCWDSSGSRIITVLGCDPDFSIIKDSTNNHKFQFVSPYKTSNYIHKWFIDGVYLYNNEKPLHTFISEGTYTICHVIADTTNNCSDTLCHNLIVKKKNCEARFNYKLSQSNASQVIFENTSYANSSAKFSWNFGDSSNSNSINPTHTYNEKWQKEYMVCLFLQDTVNCFDTSCQVIKAGLVPCDKNITYTISGKRVTFTMPAGVKKLLDFGSSSMELYGPSASHEFNNFGTYTVCYTVYCLNEPTYKTCFTITIQDSCTPNFSYTFDTLVAHKILLKNSSSMGQFAKTIWQFGDGNSSVLNNPNHTYAKDSTYKVCLTLVDSMNNCNVTKCSTIVLNTKCDAYFKDTICPFTSTRTFKFINLSNHHPNNKYLWDFGDGASSSKFNETYTYKNAGTFKVCLKVTNATTNCIDSFCKLVMPNNSCVAKWSVAVDTTQKFKLYLINSSTHSSTMKYEWVFGDGGVSQLRNPTYKYTTFGRFKVCLTIYDSGKCISSYCDTIGLDSNGKLLKYKFWELVVLDQSVFGIDEHKKQNFSTYPNPAQSSLRVDFSELIQSRTTLELVDLKGTSLFIKTIYPEEGLDHVNINLIELIPGLYILKITNDREIYYQKIFKQ